mgnify:CR=1 FL=1
MEITPKISMSKAVSTQRPGKWYVFPSQMEGTVQLCLKSNFNLPIAEIKIFDSGRYVDFIETFDDASNLGNEICRRFNQFPQEGKL